MVCSRWQHKTDKNSRFYVDDGLLPAETKQALQRMLNIVSIWTFTWRIRLRIGVDKTAFMCTGGNDAARHGHVYVTLQNGIRIKLVAVNVYVYLGLPIQSNLKYTHLLSTLRKIANQRTWSTVRLAAKYKVTLYTTLIMWKSLAFNAFKHLLVFCPFENTILEPLAKAQETCQALLQSPT